MLVGNILQDKTTPAKRKCQSSSGAFFTGGIDNDDLESKEIHSPKVNISSLWTLQALNNLDADKENMQKAGKILLKELNDLRMSFLTGELSRENMINLQEALDETDIELEYPELASLLDEIRVRVAVELEKLKKIYS